MIKSEETEPRQSAVEVGPDGPNLQQMDAFKQNPNKKWNPLILINNNIDTCEFIR